MAPKEGDMVEIECPVCDHKVPSNAKSCPGCGADFSNSGLEELEAVATELVQPEKAVVPPPVEVKIQKEEPPQPGKVSVEEEPREEEKKGGLFKRLFGKK